MIQAALCPPDLLVSCHVRAERALAVGFVALRAGYLFQAAVGVITRSLALAQPPLALAWLGGFTIESVIIGVWLLRRASITRWPVIIDCCGVVLTMAVAMAATVPADRVRPWSVGIYSVSLSSAVLVGFWGRGLPGTCLIAGALAVCYLAAALADPVRPNWSLLSAGAATDACAYLWNAGVAWVLATIIRDLADLADCARRRAAELERHRGRATVHDLLPYLNPDLLAATDDSVRTEVARQLQAKYRQMRDYVEGVERVADLATHLSGIVELHPQLVVHAALGRAARTRLESDVLERLLRAVDTALANVEQNAPHATVTIRARVGPDTLLVTVTDDGPGFELAGTRTGYGITQILGRQLEEIGGRGTVTSLPGRGTRVTLLVPRPTS